MGNLTLFAIVISLLVPSLTLKLKVNDCVWMHHAFVYMLMRDASLT